MINFSVLFAEYDNLIACETSTMLLDEFKNQVFICMTPANSQIQGGTVDIERGRNIGDEIQVYMKPEVKCM